MSSARLALNYLLSGIAIVVIAASIFVALNNVGVIGRPASENFTFGG